MTLTAFPSTVVSPTGSLRPRNRFIVPWYARVTGQVSLRCLETVAGRPVLSALAIGGTYPWLSPSVRWVEAIAGGAVITAAGLAGGRRSLPRLVAARRYRFRVRRIQRRWADVMRVNTAMSKTEHAVDQAGHPTRTPGLKRIPRLVRGWRLIRGHPVRFGPRRSPYGVIVTVDGSPTGHVDAGFVAEAAVIRGSFNAAGIKVAQNMHRPHWTDLSILFDDPFAKVIQPEDLPAPQEELGVVLGLDENGDPLEHSLWLPTLIVGRKGSGKSRVVRRILQGLCDTGQPFVLFVFDPKGHSERLQQGQEFGWLKDAAWRYESDPDRWPEFIADLCTTMTVQASRLGEEGKEECPVNDERFPLIVAVVDELGTALDETSANRKITVAGSSTTVEKALRRYLRENRSAGATMVANTQVAQKKDLSIGSSDKSIRDLFDFAICLGVNNPETTRMALGVSDAKRYPAHEIPVHRKTAGTGFASSSERGISKFRCAFTSNRASVAVAQQIATWSAFYREQKTWRIAA